MKGGEFMTILKAVSKTSMERSMELEAKTSYSACTEDCPKCRVFRWLSDNETTEIMTMS